MAPTSRSNLQSSFPLYFLLLLSSYIICGLPVIDTAWHFAHFWSLDFSSNSPGHYELHCCSLPNLSNTYNPPFHALGDLFRSTAFLTTRLTSRPTLPLPSAMARLNIPRRSPSTDSLYRNPTPPTSQRRNRAAGTSENSHSIDSPEPSLSSDKENRYDAAIQPAKSTNKFKNPMPINQNSHQHGNKRRRMDSRETPISELLSQYPRSESGNERFFNPLQDVDLRRGLRAQMRTHTRELHGTSLIQPCWHRIFGLTLYRPEERVSAQRSLKTYQAGRSCHGRSTADV
jgi:hypothetical protein